MHQQLIASKHKDNHIIYHFKFEKAPLSVQAIQSSLAWKVHSEARATEFWCQDITCSGKVTKPSINQRSTTVPHRAKSPGTEHALCTLCQFIKMWRKFGYKDYKLQILNANEEKELYSGLWNRSIQNPLLLIQ